MAVEVPTTRCPQCGKSFAATVRICPNDGTVLEHDATTASQVGKVLDGKYRLDAFLSHGGMGSVYRATHVMLGKTVAVKLINPELVTSPEVVRRFQREARAATALHHPNIVGVYDLGQTSDGTLYIAMEFVDGPSLKSLIASGGPVAPARTIALLRQVASALSFAHRHNVIHRDLKPHNIMLATSEDGHEVPKLVDFGIAKTFDEATQLTMTGFALGTPQYMAPEQAEARPVDARSDLYSLGVILYEMLAGDVPFNDASAPAILIKHIKEAPVAPSQKNPRVAIPAELEVIALRCLEKDPARRFQSADEFLAAIDSAATSIPGAAAAMQATLLIARTPAVPAGTTADAVPPVSTAAASAPALTAAAGASPLIPPPSARGGSATPDVTATAGIQSRTATPPSPSGTRPTVVPPPGMSAASVPAAQVPAAAPPATQSSRSQVLVVIAVLCVIALGGVAAFVYQKQESARVQSASPTEPPAASPAMAGQSTPAPPPPDSAPPQATGGPPGPLNPTGATPPNPTGTPNPTGATPNPIAGIPSASAAVSRRGNTGGGPTGGAIGAGTAATGVGRVNVNVARGETAPGAARSARAGAPGKTPGSQESAGPGGPPPVQPPAMTIPENPAVFFGCAGAPEVCSSLRTAVDEAIEKAGLGNVRNPSRADIVISATVEGVQERISQEFETTFAVRTYSIALNGETTHTSEAVPMPSPTTVSFDPQFGSERITEKARLVASDLVDKVKAFTRKKRGG